MSSLNPRPRGSRPALVVVIILSAGAGTVGAVAAAPGAEPGEEPSGWPASLDFLQTCGDGEFHAFVAPLAGMTNLTYTATWGSYYDEEAMAHTALPGWERAQLEANPKTGGMRALAFLQAAGQRGVVAFRGTDLNSSGVSGQADLCADAVLSGTGAAELPLVCGQFSAWTLDYLSRALEFAEEASRQHPGVEWLYTGHSLGALLAEVVAAVRRERALGFASPGVAPVLRNRTKVDPATVGAWSAAAMYNQWDPLRYEARGQLVGAECFWRIDPAPLGCDSCDGGPGRPSMETAACQLCFRATHVYAHYLDLLRSGQRPVCQPAAAAAAADARRPDFVV